MRYLALLISILFLTSCKKTNYPTGWMEKKVYGAWTVEEVRSSFKNVTGQSDEFKFEFMEDNKLVYTNRSNQSYTGTWRLSQQTNNTGDNTQTTYMISIHVSDPASGFQKIYAGNNFSVSKKRMTFNQWDNSAYYYYKLNKQ